MPILCYLCDKSLIFYRFYTIQCSKCLFFVFIYVYFDEIMHINPNNIHYILFLLLCFSFFHSSSFFVACFLDGLSFADRTSVPSSRFFVFIVLYCSCFLRAFLFLTFVFCSSHFASFLPKRCNALHFGSAPDSHAFLVALFFRLFLTTFDIFRHYFASTLRSSRRIRSCKSVFSSLLLHLFAAFHPKSGAKKEDVRTCKTVNRPR